MCIMLVGECSQEIYLQRSEERTEGRKTQGWVSPGKGSGMEQHRMLYTLSDW